MTKDYKPGQWRVRRSRSSSRIEVVRVDVAGRVYETSPCSYSRWDKAKLDADTWNEMEEAEEAAPAGPGAALATLRRLAGLSVPQAATLIGVGERFVWHVEDGRIQSTPGFFARAAEVYATELLRTGIEVSSCGECNAATVVPVHTCEKAEATT
jgi:hypothetical protein